MVTRIRDACADTHGQKSERLPFVVKVDDHTVAVSVDKRAFGVGIIHSQIVTVGSCASAYAHIMSLSQLGAEHIFLHVGKKIILTQRVDAAVKLCFRNHSGLLKGYQFADVAHGAAARYRGAAGILIIQFQLGIDIVARISHMQISRSGLGSTLSVPR